MRSKRPIPIGYCVVAWSMRAMRRIQQRITTSDLGRSWSMTSRPALPASEAALRKNGSYPSGHTAFGWAWGLILSELVPTRTNEIIRRGRAYGVSRMVCNVHWKSDVEAGRAMAPRQWRACMPTLCSNWICKRLSRNWRESSAWDSRRAATVSLKALALDSSPLL